MQKQDIEAKNTIQGKDAKLMSDLIEICGNLINKFEENDKREFLIKLVDLIEEAQTSEEIRKGEWKLISQIIRVLGKSIERNKDFTKIKNEEGDHIAKKAVKILLSKEIFKDQNFNDIAFNLTRRKISLFEMA